MKVDAGMCKRKPINKTAYFWSAAFLQYGFAINCGRCGQVGPTSQLKLSAYC